MSREVTIVTPENVTITYELAGLGSRALAYLVDLMLQMLSMLVLLLVGTLVMRQIDRLSDGSAVAGIVQDFGAAIGIIAAFLIFFGYFIYFEWTGNGQTPGKRRLGLRVVREEGAPVDFASAALRNLVRIFEMAMGFYLSSLLFILFSPKYKRLGDYAAGTMVVKDRRSSSIPEAALAPTERPSHAEARLVRDVDALTADELAAVRRFVERRHQLEPQVQEDIARQICEPLMAKMGITRPSGSFSYANLLEEVYARGVEDRGVL